MPSARTGKTGSVTEGRIDKGRLQHGALPAQLRGSGPSHEQRPILEIELDSDR
jgi:hypothetical protein